MANAGVRSKREVLLDTGYFVEKGVLSDSDIRICKDRLREIALRIDFYRDKIRAIIDVQDEAYRISRFVRLIGNEISFLMGVVAIFAHTPGLSHWLWKYWAPAIFHFNVGFVMKPPVVVVGRGTRMRVLSMFRGIPVPRTFDFWLGLDAQMLYGVVWN